jgi:hypothetical protein
MQYGLEMARVLGVNGCVGGFITILCRESLTNIQCSISSLVIYV